MRLLLDTHTLLWFLAGDPKLSGAARGLVEDDGNEVLVSVGTLWEIAIKVSLGKLGMSMPFEEFFPAQLDENGILVLSIATAHLQKVASLPFHHRDPFDRLLVAQAMSEEIPLVSRDAAFDAYGLRRLW